jgi:hypothetical protein
MKTSSRQTLTQKALRALIEAVAKVVEDHRRRGKPLAVWRDGKAIWMPVEQANAVREDSTPYRSAPHGKQS